MAVKPSPDPISWVEKQLKPHYVVVRGQLRLFFNWGMASRKIKFNHQERFEHTKRTLK